jgi:LuxR family glucitol operon transcriptional activator
MPTLKASPEGKQAIRQARNEKGWTIDDDRWLQEASKILDETWERSDCAANDIFAPGVSQPTWNRFRSGKPINSQVFKAFCQVLDLDWLTVADRGSRQQLWDGDQQQSSPFASYTALEPLQEQPRPYQNLPPRDYREFIGRQTELDQLLTLLQTNSTIPRISIEGIGGMGKTALAVEVAYRCLDMASERQMLSDSPEFEAFIFTSAQTDRLTARGLLPRPSQERSLYQILWAIAQTLRLPPETLVGDLEDQVQRIRYSLSHQSILLIVDSLETMEEQEQVLAFLYDLPATVKVITTGRESAFMDVCLRLSSLSRSEGVALIEQQAHLKQISLTSDQAVELHEKTGGIPAAILYALGKLTLGYLFEEVLPRLPLPDSDFCRFYLKRSIDPLKGRLAHALLQAIALFPRPVLRGAIVTIVRPQVDPADEFAQLCQLNLVTLQSGRYHMLPLTRDYVLAELATAPEQAQCLRERWIHWAITLLQQCSLLDWQEWNNNQTLSQDWENLCGVMEWCIAQDCYGSILALWQYLKGWTHFGGYWEHRLTWMDWLIVAAQHHADPETAATAFFDKGRILTLGDRPEQWDRAMELFETAWKLCGDQNPDLQFHILTNRISVCLQRQDIEAAQTWLQTAQALTGLPPISKGDLDRRPLILSYYQAQLQYKMGNLEGAKALYRRVLTEAEAMGWQRMVNYSRNWLADVQMAMRELEEAKHLLMVSLPEAETYRDLPCIAVCQKFLAKINHAQGNLQKAYEYALLSKENFIKLSMFNEAASLNLILEIQP